MDTPDNAILSVSCKNASCCTEDSGYITTTPKSAECQPYTTSAEAVSSRLLWKTKEVPSTSTVDRNWCTPGITSNKTYLQTKPKLLLRDVFTSKIGVQDVSNNEQVPSSNAGLEIAIDKLVPKDSPQRKALKRQIAVEDIEWCNSPSTSFSEDLDQVPSKDSSVSEVMKNLVVISPCDKSLHSTNIISILDKSELESKCSELITSDYVSSDQITPQVSQTCEYSTSPPSKKKAKKSNFNDDFEYLQRTPEKLNTSDNCIQIERKSVKRLNFTSQPLGTPEKNEILYPQLPVTPPKKLRTPEKNKHSIRTQKLRISRQLLGLRRQKLCGRESVDFLKMLGDQQNQRPAIQKILDCMSGEEIARMSMVSKIWRNVCLKDYKANRKRKIYLDEKRLTKENPNSAILRNGKFRSFSTESQSMRCLTEIQNKKNILPQPSQSGQQRSPPVSPGKRRFRMFVKAASTGPCQLITCLRCRRPAKVVREQNGELWAQCEHVSCGYAFCRKCLCERHLSGTCKQGGVEAPSPSKPKSSASKIGSRQSKRNLRRL